MLFLGTRLQMRKGKTSHKLKTCEYHNANLSNQGKLLKTMTQEAMQVYVMDSRARAVQNYFLTPTLTPKPTLLLCKPGVVHNWNQLFIAFSLKNLLALLRPSVARSRFLYSPGQILKVELIRCNKVFQADERLEESSWTRLNRSGQSWRSSWPAY